MVWDLFCRVIDNHGDVGVCWRLACGLARRGVSVRLWIDDATALAWMAPQGAAGVQVLPWPGTATDTDTANDTASGPAAELQAGDVVIEAFGCRLPDFFVAQMARQSRMPQAAPVWINLSTSAPSPMSSAAMASCHPNSAGQAWGCRNGSSTRASPKPRGA